MNLAQDSNPDDLRSISIAMADDPVIPSVKKLIAAINKCDPSYTPRQWKECRAVEIFDGGINSIIIVIKDTRLILHYEIDRRYSKKFYCQNYFSLTDMVEDVLSSVDMITQKNQSQP